MVRTRKEIYIIYDTLYKSTKFTPAQFMVWRVQNDSCEDFLISNFLKIPYKIRVLIQGIHYSYSYIRTCLKIYLKVITNSISKIAFC